MIDIQKSKKLFKGYAKKYDFKNENIVRKYNHSFSVMKLCGKISEALKLSKEDVKLAKFIGLFHDIGRFEQVTKWNTFNDYKSIDHGELAVKILEENNFLEDVKEKEIVKAAIFYHNKKNIDETLDKRTALFCNIVRDADKIDILTLYKKDLIKIEYAGKINEKLYNELFQYKILPYKDVKSLMDHYFISIGYVFDINFKYSIIYLYKNKLIINFINKVIKFNIEEKEKLEEIKKFVIKYMKKRMED